MIRIIYPCDLIWPRGDTGSITIHCPYKVDDDDVALFIVYDKYTNRVLAEQPIYINNDSIDVPFGQELAWRLMPGDYYWDVKVYHDPEYDEDGAVKGAKEIHSMYGAFRTPRLKVTEV